jgi:hypothetical protein
VLLALAAVCFARLLAHPASLIVDADNPSIDRANLAGPRQVGNDLVDYVLPQYLFITRTLSRFGHVPLWDTRGFAGRPLCGNPQGGLFYPPAWLAWWVASPAAPGWLTVAHLLWAGLGVYKLSRSLGTGRWAATVAAGVYQASPFLLAQTFEGHYAHVWSSCWYPWAFWSFLRSRAGARSGAALMPVILALTYLTGHPQEWLLLALALAVWSIVDIVILVRDRGLRPALERTFRFGGAIALSVGFVAIEIAPELAVRPWLLQNRLRLTGVPMSRRYDLSAIHGFQLLSPTALGGPADYFGDDNYWETVFSIGFAPLVLAVIAMMHHGRSRRLGGWLLLLGVSTWFAGGRNLGLYPLLYSVVPGMSWFRVPGRALFLSTLSGAVLSGVGVDVLRRGLRDRQAWRARAKILGFLMLAVFVFLLAFQAAGGSQILPRPALAAQRVLHDPRFWLAATGLSTLMAMACVGKRERWRDAAGRLTGLLALGELGWAGFALVQVAPPEKFLGPDPAGCTINRLAESDHAAGSVRIKARDSFYGDLQAAAAGLEKTNINDVFQIDHAARLYEPLYRATGRPHPHETALAMRQPVEVFDRGVRQAIFDRMSVNYLVSDRYERDPGWPLIVDGRMGATSYTVARNPTALPRAYVVPRATVVTEPPPFILSLFTELDSHRSVIMDSDPLAAAASGPRQPFTPAGWISLDPDHPVLQVTTEAPGLLVVTDTWMPGWTAQVDNQVVPILRGNVAQRVIPIFWGGNHTIIMSYRPPGLVLGTWISAGSALIWLALVAWFTMLIGGVRSTRIGAVTSELLGKRNFAVAGKET